MRVYRYRKVNERCVLITKFFNLKKNNRIIDTISSPAIFWYIIKKLKNKKKSGV